MFLFFQNPNNTLEEESIIEMRRYFDFDKRELVEELVYKMVSLIDIDTIIYFSLIIYNTYINRQQFLVM